MSDFINRLPQELGPDRAKFECLHIYFTNEVLERLLQDREYMGDFMSVAKYEHKLLMLIFLIRVDDYIRISIYFGLLPKRENNLKKTHIYLYG